MTAFFEVDDRGDIVLGDDTYVENEFIDADTGVAIDLFEPSPEHRRVRAVFHESVELQDKLFIVAAGWFVISPRSLEVFSGVSCCSSIVWTPVDLVDRTERVAATYFMAMGAKKYDIWDYARSDCYWHSGKLKGTKEAAGYFIHPVMNAKLAPSYDFFQAERGRWIATSRLRDAAVEANLTGISFESLENS